MTVGIASLPIRSVVPIPVNVRVSVSAPDPKTMELVPDPVQNVQKNAPCVVNDVVNASSPLGRITNGSAETVAEARRQNTTAKSRFRMRFSPLSAWELMWRMIGVYVRSWA